MSFTCQPEREEKNFNREEHCSECNTSALEFAGEAVVSSSAHTEQL